MTQWYTVYLAPGHPQYQEGEDKWVGGGYVTQEKLRKEYGKFYQVRPGKPHRNLKRLRPKVINERLDTLFDGRPVQERAQFYILRAAVKEALDNEDQEAAKVIIQNASIDPALHQVRALILNEFTKDNFGIGRP